MKNVDAQQPPSYIDEFMWREQYGRTAQEALSNIMDHIAEIYPVWKDSKQPPLQIWLQI